MVHRSRAGPQWGTLGSWFESSWVIHEGNATRAGIPSLQLHDESPAVVTPNHPVGGHLAGWRTRSSSRTPSYPRHPSARFHPPAMKGLLVAWGTAGGERSFGLLEVVNGRLGARPVRSMRGQWFTSHGRPPQLTSSEADFKPAYKGHEFNN